MAEVCEVSALLLKQITSVDSQATARATINANFDLLKKVIQCIGANVGDFLNILPPVTPVPGLTYNIIYNGTDYILVPASTGTKYRIQPSEAINIGSDYQYIIFNNFENYGSVTIEPGGQLVIL